MRRLLIAVAVAYGLGAVVTFGRAAAGAEPDYAAAESYCDRPETYCAPIDRAVPPPIAGMAAAALWPLYWSWELAE